MTEFNPKTNYSDIKVIESLISAAVDKARIAFPNIVFLKTFAVRFNSRMRTAGGRAKLNEILSKKTSWIELNPTYWRRSENKDRWDTVLHEVAHCLCYFAYPDKRIGHGREWKNMCRLIGLENPTRCHDTDMRDKRAKRRKFGYRCNCRNNIHMVGIVLHNKIQKGVVYRCSKCRQALRPDFVVTTQNVRAI